MFAIILRPFVVQRQLLHRSLHSPFAVLNNSSSSSSSPKDGTTTSESVYEKNYDHHAEPVYQSGLRTYVVSEPDLQFKPYQVPAGAYPVMTPFATSGSVQAGVQSSSTFADLLAHKKTTTTTASRIPSAPAFLPSLTRRGYGGWSIMDKQDRTSLSDGNAAEKYSKMSVKETGKLTK